MTKQPKLARGVVDLGDNHWLRYMCWSPDLSLNPQYAHLAYLIRTWPIVGAIVAHKCNTDSGIHEGVIHFETPLTKSNPFHADQKWQVHSWAPLTLSPSLLSKCPCNDHGFIRNGRWERA